MISSFAAGICNMAGRPCVIMSQPAILMARVRRLLVRIRSCGTSLPGELGSFDWSKSFRLTPHTVHHHHRRCPLLRASTHRTSIASSRQKLYLRNCCHAQVATSCRISRVACYLVRARRDSRVWALHSPSFPSLRQYEARSTSSSFNLHSASSLNLEIGCALEKPLCEFSQPEHCTSRSAAA